MRTTLTLDDDLYERLEAETHRLRKSFKAVVNDAIRRGMAGQDVPRDLPPFVVVPHHCEFQPGFDPQHSNRLVDELEVEAMIEKTARLERERR
jgi:uncharacterized protein (UPF0335 family)